MSPRWSASPPRGFGDLLPRWQVLLAFPALVVLVGLVLVTLGVNGTSSGALRSELEEGADPALIAGEPQAIRSDEWNVGTVWSIAQVQEGLPEISRGVPGGMDAAIPYDLPRADWTVTFRPHLIGYLGLDVGRATAWKWWVPGLALIAAAYALMVTALPRRPVSAALIAVGFFSSPFVQWWYQPSTIWPLVWGATTIAGVWWSLRTPSRSVRWGWAIAIFYLSCVMAMGIYAPFIIPVALVVTAAGLGSVLARDRTIGWPTVLSRLAPIGLAAIGSLAVCSAWLASKVEVVSALLNTAYPGQRLTQAGSSGILSLVRTVSSSFAESLGRADGFLGINSSEASTFFLAGLWLSPVLVGMIVRRVRRGERLPWDGILVVVAVLVFATFTIVPGWDSIAHVLLLDRTTGDRARIGIGLASLISTAVILRVIDRSAEPMPRSAVVISMGAFVVVQVAIALAVTAVLGGDRLLSDAPGWWLWTIVSAVCLGLFARGSIAGGSVTFFAVCVGSSLLVNPVYLGVFDVRTTATGASLVAQVDRSPGRWVGIGGPVVTALLLEAGAETYNGTQGAPSAEMWNDIDPAGVYESNWNRIGGVGWVSSRGAPVVSNPAPDKILVSFDACSSFAQNHVDFVLADSELPERCVRPVEEYLTAGGILYEYEVVRP